MEKIRLAIFGAGAFYKIRKKELDLIENTEVCIFLDNDVNLWGTMLDDVLIVSPCELNKIKYDYVVLMSVYAVDM